MNRALVILLVTAVGLAAFGCKKSSPKPPAGQQASVGATEAQADKDLQKRLDEALKK